MGLIPKIIQGSIHEDFRGKLVYNNNFDLSLVKRMYIIENSSRDIIRGWQGHKIEKRWFTVVQGSFLIKAICIDNWKQPSSDLKVLEYELNATRLDVLYVPNGYITSIQAMECNSKLTVMADYALGDVDDDYRFALTDFNKE